MHDEAFFADDHYTMHLHAALKMKRIQKLESNDNMADTDAEGCIS